MAFRLARLAGRVDVDQMLSEIDSVQFDEWVAYHQLEPLNDSHLRETLTLVGTAICRVLGSDLKPEQLRLELLHPVGQGQRPESPTSLKANLAQFAALHNASLK